MNSVPSVSGRWRIFANFISMSFSHFRKNGVGLAMSLAVPLLFMLIYGYAYLLGTPNRTISIGLLPNAAEATSWRGALPPESFRIRPIEPDKLSEHLRDGEPALIIDRNTETGLATVHATPYWRPVAELLLRALDQVGAETASTTTDMEARLHVIEPGNSPFYMLPAIMVMALLNIGLFSGGAKLLQERARGTLRMFRMLPISIGWYFSSELATKLMISLTVTAGYLALSIVMFELELSWGQLLAVVAIAMALAAVFIAIGLAIASILRDYSVGVHAFTLCNLLVLFLGDLFFNASQFPITKWIALALPTTYGMDLLRHAMFATSLRFSVLLSVSILSLWLIVMMSLAIRTFSYKARE